MIGNVEVVTIALFLLGGDKSAIDTEDVAKKAHDLAPGRFAWKKYPDQINLEMVRVSLSDAKKEAYGGWVDGSGKTGWTMTEAGRRWAAKESASLLGDPLGKDRAEGRGGGVDERRWRAERTRIMGLEAWLDWLATGRISEASAAIVFRVDAYTVGRIRSRKIARLAGLFDEDAKLRPFIRQAASVLSRTQS